MSTSTCIFLLMSMYLSISLILKSLIFLFHRF